MKRTLTILLASASLLHAEVKVNVGEVSDKRTNGKFFAGLEIALSLSGPELADAKGMRVKVDAATDDTGKALLKKEGRPFAEDFEPLRKPFGGFEKKDADAFELKLELDNPMRAAKTVKSITGIVELLVPKNDPKSVITASPAKDGGKPLESPVLKALGAEITLLTKATSGAAKSGGIFGFGGGGGVGDDELGYKLNDPKGVVAAVEFCSADGKVLETGGRMSSGGAGNKSYTISFRDKPPADAVAKIYLLTEKSLVKVPLNLSAVPLP